MSKINALLFARHLTARPLAELQNEYERWEEVKRGQNVAKVMKLINSLPDQRDAERLAFEAELRRENLEP